MDTAMVMSVNERYGMIINIQIKLRRVRKMMQSSLKKHMKSSIN